MPGPATGATATSSRIERFLRDKDGRADRLPIGAVYEATMRCNLHCEFCYVIDFLNIEGEWRQEMTVERLRAGVPRSAGVPGQPHGRRDLHAQGHHVRAGPLPGEGVLLRLPDDQRHDHQRGTRRGAGRSGGGGLPQAHQRVGRRSRGAARSRARLEGHVRTHLRRPAPAPGRGATQARAAARQHQHDGRAGEPRGARCDGRRGRRARRRRHRAQPPDVQHAGRGRGNRPDDRRRRSRR